MNRIRFSHAVLFILITSTIVAVWMATKAHYFDDTFTGKVVVNGVVTDISASVKIQTVRFDKNPSLSFRLDAPNREQAIAKGLNPGIVDTEITCKVTGYDDKRNNKEFAAVVAVQFDPYAARQNCSNAVMKIESFGKMTVIINPSFPSKRVEMTVEREYLRNPVIMAAQYIAYVSGRRAMNFY